MSTSTPSRRSSQTSTHSQPHSLRRNSTLSASPFATEFEDIPQDSGRLSLADELAELEDTASDAEQNTTETQIQLQSPPRPRRVRRRSSLMRHIALDESVELTPSEIDVEIEAALSTQLSNIENLCRPPSTTTLDEEEEDDVFTRVERLLQLPLSESTLSAPSTRLATAHSAIASFIDESTGALLRFSHEIFSPWRTLVLSEADAEYVIDVLGELGLLIPSCGLDALGAMHGLRVSGEELGSTLAGLKDTLSVARQSESVAGRRLRSAFEMLEVLKREERDRERGEVYLASGEWDRRIKEREASRTCREVVLGFESVCEGWMRRLVDGAAA